jgi:8-oxo-dGTP pyrophosphatase MutT (NUDIX family)
MLDQVGHEGFRGQVACVREAFEETGILPVPNASVPSQESRTMMTQHPIMFLDFAKQLRGRIIAHFVALHEGIDSG